MAKLKKHHMSIHWKNIKESKCDTLAYDATLKEKAILVGRVGLMMLSVGTGAWRVRDAMNTVSRSLNISCSADIGLLSITYTCIDGGDTYTQSVSLPNTGVNTDKLMSLESFLRDFPECTKKHSTAQIHELLDEIQNKKGNYNALTVGLAAGIACGAFTFLLGGGIIEMLCAFIGAGVGNFVRRLMIEKKISLIANVAVSVAASCVAYVVAILLMQMIFSVPKVHQAGYICAMLFVIPGFPLITGGIDLAKLDMRSGIERTLYALLIITTATVTGAATAMVCKFRPGDLLTPTLNLEYKIIFRMIASFLGVYNFSLMFNSTKKMAFTAGLIGMISNTLRLELVDLVSMPAIFAAFIGAFCSGCIASAVKKKIGFPRISLTVPSIVIMVPGMYMYRGIFHMGLSDVGNGALWLTKAILIVIALPLGLVAARIITDKNFRHCT